MGLSSEDLEKIKSIVHSSFTEKFLNKIATKVVEMVELKFEAKFKTHNTAINELSTKVSELQESNMALKGRVVEMERKCDEHEQSSRNSNIRIFGLPYNGGENIRLNIMDLFNNEFKVGIKEADITKCYRVKSRNPSDKPPAVIVRFSTDAARSSVFANRKNLKNSGIQIKEDLTKCRLLLLEGAVKKFTFRHAWCLNGNVYVRSSDNRVHRVNKASDLDQISAGK